MPATATRTSAKNLPTYRLVVSEKGPDGKSSLRQIGAFWERTSAKGETMFSGRVSLKDQNGQGPDSITLSEGTYLNLFYPKSRKG